MQRIEESLEGLQRICARIEAAEEQQKQTANTWFSQTWPAHMGEHKELEKRLGSLERTRSEAKGAATLGKLLWAGIVAAATAIGFVARHLLGGDK